MIEDDELHELGRAAGAHGEVVLGRRTGTGVTELIVDGIVARDAVLLDVDNGPAFLLHPSNAGLYSAADPAPELAALRPRGVLAIWAADPAPELAERLSALPGTTDVEHLVLPVERDGRRFDHAIVSARADR